MRYALVLRWTLRLCGTRFDSWMRRPNIMARPHLGRRQYDSFNHKSQSAARRASFPQASFYADHSDANPRSTSLAAVDQSVSSADAPCPVRAPHCAVTISSTCSASQCMLTSRPEAFPEHEMLWLAGAEAALLNPQVSDKADAEVAGLQSRI